MLHRFFIIGLVALLINSVSLGDTNDLHNILTTEDPNPCYEYGFNCLKIIPRLHEEGKVDSINSILEFWEEKCKINEVLFRTKLLLAIEIGYFDENAYDSSVVDYFSEYRLLHKSLFEYNTAPWWSLYSLYDYEVVNKYEQFTYDLARNQAVRNDPNTLEHLISAFYGGEFDYFYKNIMSDTFKWSKLHEYYMARIDSLKSTRYGKETNYGLLLGVWLPTDNLELVGNHPAFGAFYGHSLSGWWLEMSIACRIFKSSENYIVSINGNPETTDNFTGLNLSFDFGRMLIDKGKSRLSVLTGIGFDGIYTGIKESEEKMKVINTFNANGGLRYQYFPGKYHTWYIGIQTRYHLLNFKSGGGGSDLSGDAITISILIGRSSDAHRTNALKYLGY